MRCIFNRTESERVMGVVGWVLKKAFGAAVLGGTGATLWYNRDNLMEGAENKKEELAQSIEENGLAGTIERATNTVVNTAKEASNYIDNTGDSIVDNYEGAKDKYTKTKSMFDKAADTVDKLTGGGDEENMTFFQKLLLGGGAAFSLKKVIGDWLLGGLFGKDKEEDKKNDGFGWGKLLIATAFVGATIWAFNNRNELDQKLDEVVSKFSGDNDEQNDKDYTRLSDSAPKLSSNTTPTSAGTLAAGLSGGAPIDRAAQLGLVDQPSPEDVSKEVASLHADSIGFNSNALGKITTPDGMGKISTVDPDALEKRYLNFDTQEAEVS